MLWHKRDQTRLFILTQHYLLLSYLTLGHKKSTGHNHNWFKAKKVFNIFVLWFSFVLLVLDEYARAPRNKTLSSFLHLCTSFPTTHVRKRGCPLPQNSVLSKDVVTPPGQYPCLPCFWPVAQLVTSPIMSLNSPYCTRISCPWPPPRSSWVSHDF